MIKEYLIAQTSDTGGDSTDTPDSKIFGKLYAVAVVDGDYEDNFDVTLSYVNSAGVTVTLLTLTDLSADVVYYPREQVCDNTGAGMNYNDESDEPVETMAIVAGIVTSTLADGGDTKSGKVLIYVEV